MPDTPESPGPGGTIQVRNIRAERQLSREMTVERLTVNTGEERSAESDLMNEVKDILTDQTATLDKSLSNIENIVQMQLNALRGMSKDGTKSLNSLQGFQDAIKKAITDAFAGVSGGGGGGGGGSPGDTSIKELDKDLQKSIDKLRESIVALGANEAAAAGGEGGGGGGGGVGDAAARAKRFGTAAAFADMIMGVDKEGKAVTRSFSDISKSFRAFTEDGVISQLRGNIIQLADSVQTAVASIVDSSKITQFVTDRFNLSLEAATSGVAEMGGVFMDFAPGFMRGGDNLKDTLGLVRTSLESDLISPLGILGADLFEVSESIRGARIDFRDQGVNAMSRLSFQDANEAIMQLLALEKRRDVQSDLSGSMTRRNVADQLEFAQMIATNTGRTANEVIKLNMERARAMRNLEAGGILQGGERENFEQAINVFANTPGMGPFAEMLAQVARSGGSIDAFLAQNPEMAESMAAAGTIPELRGLIDTVRGAASMSPDDFANALMGRASGFNTGNNFTGIAGSQVISDQYLELAGAGGMARDFRADQEPGSGVGLVRGIQDFFANYLPSAEIGLLAAIVANTAMLGLNTAALMGGMGGMGRGIASAARGVGRAGMAAGRMGVGAATAGAGMLGRGAMAGGRLVGRSLLKKIPLIGLGAGLLFAGQRAMAGDWAGAGAEVLSGAASTVPGLGTAASVAIDAGLAARDMGAFDGSSAAPSVGPSASPASANEGIRTDTQRLLLENNRSLDRIIALLEEHGGTFEGIERNTAASLAGIDPDSLNNFFERANNIQATSQ